MNKLKIINDPIYGFINIPNELIFDLIAHPYFQRLRRIAQMGLSYLVYPGAHHTRFHHAIGAMHLMQTAIHVLRSKNIEITKDEEEAALVAILLHDIGHGPFSHALEQSIINEISHEDISLAIMHKLNNEFKHKLDLAIDIFRGNYHKIFLTELISSQIDMDRLDYLKRDSFYSGVIEGQINSERLIKMLNVKDNRLVVDEKGIYSVEKFIISRRLMYWQVYFHKTGFIIEKILAKILTRVKQLIKENKPIEIDDNLLFLFKNNIKNPDDKSLSIFTKLDDSDIVYHLKKWKNNSDYILSYLSAMVIDRKFNKAIIQKEQFKKTDIEKIQNQVLATHRIKKNEIDYLVYSGSIKHKAYNKEKHPILILSREGNITEFSEASDQFNIAALSKPVIKHYLSYPKIKKL